MATRCSVPIICVCYSATSFTTVSSSASENVNLSAPIQYRAEWQPRCFLKSVQDNTEAILWASGGWICRFDRPSKWLHGKFEKDESEIANFLDERSRRICIYHMPALCTTKQSLMAHNSPVQYALCDANTAHALLITYKQFDICSPPCLLSVNSTGYIWSFCSIKVLNLQFEYYNCTQSWIHLGDWFKTAAMRTYVHCTQTIITLHFL